MTTRRVPLLIEVVVAELVGVVVIGLVVAVEAVADFWREILVANPTKNVTDPLLAFCAPNCLKKRGL